MTKWDNWPRRAPAIEQFAFARASDVGFTGPLAHLYAAGIYEGYAESLRERLRTTLDQRFGDKAWYATDWLRSVKNVADLQGLQAATEGGAPLDWLSAAAQSCILCPPSSFHDLYPPGSEQAAALLRPPARTP